MKLAVIGAGAIGSAIAMATAEAGAQVTLIEARHPGAGTSGTTFGWVNANNKQPRSYHDLNVAGVREHHAMSGQGSRAFHATGHVETAQTTEHADRLAARTRRLTQWGYPVTSVDENQVRTLVPPLAASRCGLLAAFYPDEGYCDVPVFIDEAVGRAVDAGATLRTDLVSGLRRHPDHVDVHCRSGDTLAFDRVVVAAGRWSAALLDTAGARLPMDDPEAPSPAQLGFLATTEPLALALDRVLTTSSLSLRPAGAGRLLLQALDLDACIDPTRQYSPRHAVGRELVARLTATLQLLEMPEPPALAHLQVGVRAMPADGRTVSGFVDETDQVYVTVTHSGITLAPLLGRLAADELFGKPSGMLADFRPGRFSAPA